MGRGAWGWRNFLLRGWGRSSGYSQRGRRCQPSWTPLGPTAGEGGAGARALAAAAAAAAASPLPAPVPGWPRASRPDAVRSLYTTPLERARPYVKAGGGPQPMARQLEPGALGRGASAQPIAAWRAPGAGWGKGSPPRADLGAGIAVAAAGSPAGPARRVAGPAVGGGGGQGRAPPACHRAPPLRRVTFWRLPGLARHQAERARLGGAHGALGRREAAIPWEEAPGRKAPGVGGPRAPAPRGQPCDARAAEEEGDGGSSRAAFQSPRLRSGRRRAGPGLAARAALMARLHAAERAPSGFLSGLGTCPSLQGAAQYGEQSFTTASAGGERTAELRARLGSVCYPRPRRARPGPCPYPAPPRLAPRAWRTCPGPAAVLGKASP
ncbi:translation initiation factor IF-2-like [Ochotona curzoniae]|uniref:translation initiation factor IF-2-like n=1 Tax=Ochotona curzoniae TaxID=130825 RepID=UPI001B350480|nr:translation initiation factor IF-2-like [Ochotona curzoniae]